MTLHDKYALSKVINAAGTFTPVGVSRSSAGVSEAVAQALGQFVVMSELQDVASQAIARWSGGQAGTVVHCAAAGITLAIAAAMVGTDAERIAALPDAEGVRNQVLMPRTHAVNYGHSILQAVRLSGARPLLAGTDAHCGIDELEAQMINLNIACLLVVSSRLTHGTALDLERVVAMAHRFDVPVVLDAAAQDWRVAQLLAAGADMTVFSAQKYLAAPTAGIVIGRQHWVDAVRAQENGIGRGMKASKEALLGVLQAIAEREQLDSGAWFALQDEKVRCFIAAFTGINDVTARAVADPAGMPMSRVHLSITSVSARLNASALAKVLKGGSPSIWVMEHLLAENQLVLELTMLDAAEIDQVASRITALLGQ